MGQLTTTVTSTLGDKTDSWEEDDDTCCVGMSEVRINGRIHGLEFRTLIINAKCPIFLGNFTPTTSNYCLKNRAHGFPGGW